MYKPKYQYTKKEQRNNASCFQEYFSCPEQKYCKEKSCNLEHGGLCGWFKQNLENSCKGEDANCQIDHCKFYGDCKFPHKKIYCSLYQNQACTEKNCYYIHKKIIKPGPGPGPIPIDGLIKNHDFNLSCGFTKNCNKQNICPFEHLKVCQQFMQENCKKFKCTEFHCLLKDCKDVHKRIYCYWEDQKIKNASARGCSYSQCHYFHQKPQILPPPPPNKIICLSFKKGICKEKSCQKSHEKIICKQGIECNSKQNDCLLYHNDPSIRCHNYQISKNQYCFLDVCDRENFHNIYEYYEDDKEKQRNYCKDNKCLYIHRLYKCPQISFHDYKTCKYQHPEIIFDGDNGSLKLFQELYLFIEPKKQQIIEKFIQKLNLQVLFIVDCTFSMKRYIELCCNEIEKINIQIKLRNQIKIEYGFLGYSDIQNNEHLFPLNFTENLDTFREFVNTRKNNMQNGHDYCEDVRGALDMAMNQQFFSWNKQSVKCCYFFSDAPGHGFKYHDLGKNNDHYYNNVQLRPQIEDSVQKFAKNNIDLTLIKIDDSTIKMYDLISQNYQIYQNSQNKINICPDLKESSSFVSFIIKNSMDSLTRQIFSITKTDSENLGFLDIKNLKQSVLYNYMHIFQDQQLNEENKQKILRSQKRQQLQQQQQNNEDKYFQNFILKDPKNCDNQQVHELLIDYKVFYQCDICQSKQGSSKAYIRCKTCDWIVCQKDYDNDNYRQLHNNNQIVKNLVESIGGPIFGQQNNENLIQINKLMEKVLKKPISQIKFEDDIISQEKREEEKQDVNISKLRCPSKIHKLAPQKGNTISCDLCNQKNCEFFLGCRNCNYDICKKCSDYQNNQRQFLIEQIKKKFQKVEQKNIIEDLKKNILEDLTYQEQISLDLIGSNNQQIGNNNQLLEKQNNHFVQHSCQILKSNYFQTIDDNIGIEFNFAKPYFKIQTSLKQFSFLISDQIMSKGASRVVYQGKQEFQSLTFQDQNNEKKKIELNQFQDVVIKQHMVDDLNKKLDLVLSETNFLIVSNYVAKQFNYCLHSILNDQKIQQYSQFDKEENFFFYFVSPFIIKENNNYYTVEQQLKSSNFVKYNNNFGFIAQELDESENNENLQQIKRYNLLNKLAQAFSHFSFQLSNGYLIIVDLQGTENILTDPAIHSLAPQYYQNKTNFHVEGILMFFLTHKCNEFCNLLNLVDVTIERNEQDIKKQLFNFFQKDIQINNNTSRIVACCDICFEQFILDFGQIKQNDQNKLKVQLCNKCKKISQIIGKKQCSYYKCQETIEFSPYYSLRKQEQQEICQKCQKKELFTYLTQKKRLTSIGHNCLGCKEEILGQGSFYHIKCETLSYCCLECIKQSLDAVQIPNEKGINEILCYRCRESFTYSNYHQVFKQYLEN